MDAAPAPKSTQLAKPAEWFHYLIDAAVAISLEQSEGIVRIYDSANAAKMSILETLSSLAVKGKYSWPVFAAMELDFDQIMRLRRALVTDLYQALLAQGRLRVGSVIDNDGPENPPKRLRLRDDTAVTKCCPTQWGLHLYCLCDTDLHSEVFITNAMKTLLERSGVKESGVIKSCKTSDELADRIVDGLYESYGWPSMLGLGSLQEQQSRSEKPHLDSPHLSASYEFNVPDNDVAIKSDRETTRISPKQKPLPSSNNHSRNVKGKVHE
ncbi:hypothetical protein BU24DRAFT_477317 [Aaosphaeria arxii CBS 175.79]|uniref:Uncharacterized protein n=1 Tax=Aaosphaeria arxii CBS 175.79 TaxID=1450172 RepID=A0A6A5Y3N6_9PLEO|nr:uncharacterized protein BU24DRAFT_477317 [Aaosphaeria arxii CBS 175.79]KAF2020165.1 hypothetical protein BU24DRAFT_477317 [Aaosphaeria arxii CBS 175.79]